MIAYVYRTLSRYSNSWSFPVGQSFTNSSSNQFRNALISTRSFSCDVNPRDIAKAAVKKERSKTPEAIKVTLLNENDEIISVTTIPEAEKMAVGKDMRLIKIIDNDIRTKRPIYKLMPDSQFIQEDLKLRREKKQERKKSNSFIKGEKVLVTTSKITSSDLEMKCRKAIKWLENKYEVRVLITGNPETTSPQEEVYKKLENSLQGKCRIVQKVYSAGNLKLQILPLREEDSTGTKKSSSANEEDIAKSSNL